MPVRGDLVWGKLKSFSWWPAIVINPEDCGRDTTTKDKLWLFWFGDHKISQVDCTKVQDFKQHFSENSNNIGKLLRAAIQEILIIYAELLHAHYTDPTALFDWANSGFKSSLSTRRKRKLDELPEIVIKALQCDNFKRKCDKFKTKCDKFKRKCDKFKRKCDIDSDSDSDNEIDSVIEDVHKGSKTLREICVACCQPEVKLVMQHPLFIGGVCQKCRKDIIKMSEMPPSKAHDICFVCGQGGILVYCSINQCLRSFCKLCIDYLAPKDSYSKILQNDDWQCYLCEKDLDLNCLIQKRELAPCKPVPVLFFPKRKSPMRVIAHNNAALVVIKDKKIVTEAYYTESTRIFPPSIIILNYYRDFSKREFANICADLIYGSFIGFKQLDQNNFLELFATSFYKFLFRLDNARIYNPLVSFIFMSECNMLDAESLSCVLRYLRVEPISIELGKNKLLLWCNIPDLRFIKFSKQEINEDKSIEEKVLSKCMEPLTYYFKQMP